MKKQPIGFWVNKDENIVREQPRRNDEKTTEPRKSIVEIYFPDRNMHLSYYNDQFDLKVGDFVFVDGKLEGLRGRVTSVNYSFKIKPADYKKVISVIDTSLHGECYHAGSHIITFDKKTIPYEKVRSWFMAPNEDEFVSGEDNEVFALHDLGGMKIKNEIADRGHQYYIENKVVYVSVEENHGRALVNGGNVYEVEFYCENSSDGYLISNLTCSCFCAGRCKHEFAAMLQLKETLELITNNYCTEYNDYFAALSKNAFIDVTFYNRHTGGFKLY